MQREEPLQFLARYHRFISFALYLAGGSGLQDNATAVSRKTHMLFGPSASTHVFFRGGSNFTRQCLYSRVELQITLLGRKESKKRNKDLRETGSMNSWVYKLIYNDRNSSLFLWSFHLLVGWFIALVNCSRMCHKPQTLSCGSYQLTCYTYDPHTLCVKRTGS